MSDVAKKLLALSAMCVTSVVAYLYVTDTTVRTKVDLAARSVGAAAREVVDGLSAIKDSVTQTATSSQANKEWTEEQWESLGI